MAQTLIGQYDTMRLPLENSKFGNSVPVLYSVANSSATVEAENLLNYLGPNNRLLNQSALLSRFDIDGISRGDGGLDAIGISFDQLDLQSKYSTIKSLRPLYVGNIYD